MRRAKNSLKYILPLLLLGLICQVSFSQNTSKKPLIDVLNDLETTYEVRFSYAPSDIATIEIEPPTPSLAFPEILSYLSENTSLIFNQIDARYITISPPGSELRCGTLIDAITRRPIDAATVSVENKVVSITDSNGRFSIASEVESPTIKINHVGYNTLTIDLNQLASNCPTFAITARVTALNEVVLSQLFVRGITKKDDGTVAINASEFGLLPGQVDNDVLQIIQAIPGVESINETVSNINIRGGTHDENLILWDDIRMYQSGHFFGLISAFNPDITENVVVHKNGTHARYGESTSGVIAMSSKDQIMNSLRATVGLNLINGNAYVSMPISKKVGIQVAGRRSINQLFQTPVYNNFANRVFQNTEITNTANNQSDAVINSEEDFNFYDFSTKLVWTPSEKNTISFNFLTIDNSLTFTETIREFSLSTSSNLEQRSLVGGVSFERQWNDKWSSKIMGYGTYYLLNANNKDIFTTQEVFQENEVLETGVKLDVHYTLSNQLKLDGGYQFAETGIANTQDVNLPRFRSFEKVVIRRHSVFTMATYSPNENKTIFTGGFRGNYFGKFNKLLIEPRLQVYHELGKGFSINWLGEFKSQSSTQRIDFDSDFLGIEKRRWVLANEDDIPITTSKQASIGAGFKKNNWLLSLAGFYKKVKGITTSNEGFQNQFQFVRATGSYDVKGLELVINRKTGAFSTWLSYLLMENRYNFPTLQPSEFPHNLDVRHAATLASSFTKNKFKLALGVNWHSGKPFTIPSEEQIGLFDIVAPFISYETPNAERLENYFRTDLSAEYHWEISERVDAKINVAILNVFDTKNTLNLRYVLEGADGEMPQISKVAETSLGLTPNFALQIFF